MTTIEITTTEQIGLKESLRRLQFEYPISFDRLDASTLNVITEDEDCDKLTDYLEENNLEWRMV